MRLFTSACVVALLAGCASQPRSESVPAAPVVKTAATSTKAGVPAGYKAVERNGTTLYCTNVASLGTKFKREVCMTQDEYDEVQRRGEDVRQDLRKSTRICGGGTGPSSCSGG
jgi:hypothetical protein